MRIGAFEVLAACLMNCAASSCFAQSRPNTATMSCKAAAHLVASRGAIVLSTGPTTYDRYVVDGAFCTSDEILQPAFVPSADDRQCFIGYYCYPRESKDVR